MTRSEILTEISKHRKKNSEILFVRGNKIWRLHHYSHGIAEIELSEYGVN